MGALDQIKGIRRAVFVDVGGREVGPIQIPTVAEMDEMRIAHKKKPEGFAGALMAHALGCTAEEWIATARDLDALTIGELVGAVSKAIGGDGEAIKRAEVRFRAGDPGSEAASE